MIVCGKDNSFLVESQFEMPMIEEYIRKHNDLAGGHLECNGRRWWDCDLEQFVGKLEFVDALDAKTMKPVHSTLLKPTCEGKHGDWLIWYHVSLEIIQIYIHTI